MQLDETFIIVDILSKFSEPIIILFLFLSSLLENVFPPYPGDVATFLVAVQVGQGQVSLVFAFLAVYLGNLIGAILMYHLGIHIHHVLKSIDKKLDDSNQRSFKLGAFKLFRNLFSEKNLQSTKHWLSHWGLIFVLLSRFSFGLRFFVSVVAGMSSLQWPLYFSVFSFSVIIFNGLLFWLGMTAGTHLEEVQKIIGLYGLFLAILLICIIVYKNRKYLQRMIGGIKNFNAR